MPFHDFFRDRETNARAGIIRFAVKALKDYKNTIIMLRVYAYAVVFYGKQPGAALPLRAYMNARRLGPAEFNGVADEILD